MKLAWKYWSFQFKPTSNDENQLSQDKKKNTEQRDVGMNYLNNEWI